MVAHGFFMGISRVPHSSLYLLRIEEERRENRGRIAKGMRDAREEVEGHLGSKIEGHGMVL